MVQTLLAGFAETLRRHSTWVLVLVALVTMVGGYGASKSRVDNSLEVWQSADAPDWQAYRKFIQRTGLVDPLIIFIPRQLDALTLDELLDDLNGVPDVGFCESVGLETIKGGRGTLLTLTPISGATPSQLAVILKQVPQVLRKYQVDTVHLGGVWYLTNRLDTLSAQATTLLFPVVLLVVSLVVFFLCRTQALLIVSCGLISAVLLVGTIGLCGVKMNMVLLALPPLTLILGMAQDVETGRALAEFFPSAVLLPGYGNSLFGVTFEQEQVEGQPSVFFVHDQRLQLRLIPLPEDDQDTPRLTETVAEGERGRVMFHRFDASFLLINMLERDTAIRVMKGGRQGLADIRGLSFQQETGGKVY